MYIAIIDYGMSNLGSIKNALVECGGENVNIITDPKDLGLATHVILPGVGSFKDGMLNLQKLGWIEPLRKTSLEDKIPLLGICLGMQLLSDTGFEGGEIEGLGLIAGKVKKLEVKEKTEKIPHVGWNEVYPSRENPLFANIPDGTDFYFVHSYHFVPKDNNNILATTPYCGNFASAVISENIYGTQFHPEKSQRPGFQLLKNFINL